MGCKSVRGVVFIMRSECAWVKEILNMKKIVDSKCKGQLLKMNIQFFADDGTSDSGNPSGAKDDMEEIKFGSQSELDSWFDKRMEKSLSTARSNWDKEAQEKLEEAERKGKMTAEELAKSELDEERSKLEQERLEVQREKDEAATIKKLSADKLPDSLANALFPLFGQDEKILNEAYDNIAKSFRESVELAVNERLAESARIPGHSGSNTMDSIGSKYAKEKNTKTEVKTNLWDK